MLCPVIPLITIFITYIKWRKYYSHQVWSFHFCSCVVFQFVSAIPCTCFGIIFSRLLTSMGTSSLLTATIFNLSLVFSGIFGCLCGPLVAEFGWRRVAFISSLVFGMGMIISSLATSAWFLIFFYSIEVGKMITIEFNVFVCHIELRELCEKCEVLFCSFWRKWYWLLLCPEQFFSNDYLYKVPSRIDISGLDFIAQGQR